MQPYVDTDTGGSVATRMLSVQSFARVTTARIRITH